MNREIKFRAWDSKTNKYIKSVPQKEFLLDYPDSHVSHHDCENDVRTIYLDCVLGTSFGGRLIFEQYSGMKDKNGKEIYEGDIVEFNGERSFVMFCYGTFLIDGYGEFYDFVKSSTPDILEDWLVVGNIFENKELIE